MAVKCGGTDATSGLAANPTVGAMSNKLVDAGATVILSEINELVGAETYWLSVRLTMKYGRKYTVQSTKWRSTLQTVQATGVLGAQTSDIYRKL